MKWTRNDREVWYLAGILLASLALTHPRLLFMGSGSILLFVFGPLLIHLPAFAYGVYTQEDQPDRGIPGQKENYLLALFISAPLSYFVTIRIFPYVEVLIFVAALLIPTFHAYSEYEKYGDVREVVLLILIYAPWAQFLRLFTGYIVY